MKKKLMTLTAVLMCGVQLMNMVHAKAEEAKQIAVQMNNEQVTVRAQYDETDTLYVEARKFFESNKYAVSWNEAIRKVVVHKDNNEMIFNFNNRKASINGFYIDKPIMIVNDILYIPIENVSLALGQKVEGGKENANVVVTDRNDPFRPFEWDTSYEVVKAESRQLKELSDLEYVVGYNGYFLFDTSSQVYYHFKDKKLKEIAYRATDRRDNSLKLFSKIKCELERAYGKPVFDTPNIVDKQVYKTFMEQYRDKSNEAFMNALYQLILKGDATIIAEWKTKDFSVHLMVSGGNAPGDYTYTDVSIRQNGFVFTGSSGR